jgi:hypothetical protein
VDECNIVSLDLGDTPFSIARDLPPIFVLDLVVGDTFAQKRSDTAHILRPLFRVSWAGGDGLSRGSGGTVRLA